MQPAIAETLIGAPELHCQLGRHIEFDPGCYCAQSEHEGTLGASMPEIKDSSGRRKGVFATRSYCTGEIITADPVRGACDWAWSALPANGLDPTKILAADLPHVLFHLQKTGRIVPLHEFASVSIAMHHHRELLS
jgi:hypothetical protein